MTESYRPGQTLRDRRIALGLTRETVASAAGVSAATVYRVETGRTTPNASTLAVLCGVLNLTADDLDHPGLAARETTESAHTQ